MKMNVKAISKIINPLPGLSRHPLVERTIRRSRNLPTGQAGKSAKVYCSLLLAGIMLSSCADFLQVDPPKTQIVNKSVFASDATATAVITGTYSEMLASYGFASGYRSSVSFITGLSADELQYPSSLDPAYAQFYENALTNDNAVIRTSLWEGMYKYNYYANTVIEGVANSATLTTATKKQLEGEAKFIRAFCHFYLVNLWGDVPLVTSTDYRVNSRLSRSPADDVYAQIIADLQDAVILLRADYSVSNNERIRPNAWAAKALLARAYLFTEDWGNAELYATEIISNPLYDLAENLDEVFLANSLEAIWQLKPVEPGFNTYEGDMYRIATVDNFFLTGNQVMAFEPGDNRKAIWTATVTINSTTYTYPYKYRVLNRNMPVTEYSMVLRLAEVILIRSEARARQDKLTQAIADLDLIRERANLPLIGDVNPSITKDDLLPAIWHERQVELFGEWGHRWLDLKRTNRATTILAPVKVGWHPDDALYPVPQSERLNNTNLGQNPGY